MTRRTESRRSVLLYALSTSIFGISPPLIADTSDLEARELAERILKEWESRFRTCRTAKYVVEGTVLIPRGSIGTLGTPGTFPEKDYKYSVRLHWDFDFEKRCIRVEQAEQIFAMGRNEFLPQRKEFFVTQDRVASVRTYLGEGGKRAQEVRRHASRNPARFRHLYDGPVFWAHGLVDIRPDFPTVGDMRGMRDPSLRWSVESDPPVLPDQRVEVSVRHPDSQYSSRLTVNLDKAAAVESYESRTPGGIEIQIHAKYRRDESGVFLPSEWTCRYWRQNALAKVADLKVKDVKIDEGFPESWFDVDAREPKLSPKGG